MAPTAGTASREKIDRQHSDEQAARLRGVIGRLGRLLRPTRAGADLTPSQTTVLFTIVRTGPIGLSQLATVEKLNPTMLSRVTGQLAQEGLIRRSPDPSDRRSALVEATAAGARLRARIHRERAQALSAHLRAMPQAEQRKLLDALPALEQLAELIAQEGPWRD